MKLFKNIQILLLLTTSLLVVGCGNSSGYSKSNTTEVLSVNQEVEVYPSDKVQPHTDDTVIEVRHILDNDKRYVTLISGSADIIRGDYEIE